MSGHRVHVCPDDGTPAVCADGAPFCQECLQRWPCPGSQRARPTRTVPAIDTWQRLGVEPPREGREAH